MREEPEDVPIRAPSSCGPSLSRRSLLRIGATGLLGATFGTPARPIAAAIGEPRIRARRRLRRTGLEISDISYGSSRTRDPDVVRHALARGINYFDTAEGYQDGASETAIGEALAGHREQVLIASKTKVASNATPKTLMADLEGSLRRLRMDHVDVYFNHAVNDLETLEHEGWRRFTETLPGRDRDRPADARHPPAARLARPTRIRPD